MISFILQLRQNLEYSSSFSYTWATSAFDSVGMLEGPLTEKATCCWCPYMRLKPTLGSICWQNEYRTHARLDPCKTQFMWWPFRFLEVMRRSLNIWLARDDSLASRVPLLPLGKYEAEHVCRSPGWGKEKCLHNPMIFFCTYTCLLCIQASFPVHSHL